MALPFTEIAKIFNLENQATSKTKLKEILYKLKLNTNIYMRNSNFSLKDVILSLFQIRGTYWVAYINDEKLDSYVCRTTKFFI